MFNMNEISMMPYSEYSIGPPSQQIMTDSKTKPGEPIQDFYEANAVKIEDD